MLIAMAGLPGTSKSTLATRLAQELGGVVLSKDVVRAALFPPPVLDFSREQDDTAMAAVYHAAGVILRADPSRAILIDGRTFLQSYQVQDLLTLATSLNEKPFLIHCVCDDEVARRRLEQDQLRGTHLATNRTFELYQAVKARSEPIRIPHLRLDTGVVPLDGCVEPCLAYLRGA